MSLSVKERLERIEHSTYPAYQSGLQLLQDSGVLEVLKLVGRPASRRNANTSENAYAAAYSQGYFACLDNLELFKETILDRQKAPEQRKPPIADYQAIKTLEASGRITAKEAAILRGQAPPEDEA